MLILNLSRHQATPAQINAGIVEPEKRWKVENLLEFDSKPSFEEIQERAEALAELATGFYAALIDGPAYLVPALEEALLSRGIDVIYTFEKESPGGEVVFIKTMRKWRKILRTGNEDET